VAQDKEFVRPVCTAVAVFDVAPFRPSYFQTLGIASDYYAGDSAIAFISDTQVVTNKLGLQMLWKRKRHFGAVTHPRYRRAAASVSVARNVEDVDPMVAAARIIEVAAAVVSFPFTSTALIARRLGKPSCYYDPTGTVDPEDPAAHGIPVVRGQKQLAQWLQLNIGISSSTRSAP
jgi:polysaccharide biosynthesis PFTS motif protein